MIWQEIVLNGQQRHMLFLVFLVQHGEEDLAMTMKASVAQVCDTDMMEQPTILLLVPSVYFYIYNAEF